MRTLAQIQQEILEQVSQVMRKRGAILEEYSNDVIGLISAHADIESDTTALMKTATRFNVDTLEDGHFTSIVNFRLVNNIRGINEFFSAVNHKLLQGGLFIGCLETSHERKRRILNKFWPVFGHVYYMFDFIFKRVFPKIPVLKKIYFFVTAGRNTVLSEAETLGRLASGGFEILERREIGNVRFFVARKTGESASNDKPSYGILFRMNRLGLHGKKIGVYKIRTMHPYAEFLQQYVYENHDLQEGGKFREDFRITSWGKVMRRFWIDELPMLVNLLRGDVKLVGIRPLSAQYFSLYSEALRERRPAYKPGIIPPYYVDMPKTLDEIMASEQRYMDAYDKAPIRTDVRYFFLAISNILFRKARSN